MTSILYHITDDLNEDYPERQVPFSAQQTLEPATGKGFRFLKACGDKMGTAKHITYKPAKLHCKGDKWFVYYSFFHEGKFHRLKVYEGINRIKNVQEKKEFGLILVTAVNEELKSGFNPFLQQTRLAEKNWTLIQAINYFIQKLPDMGMRNQSIQSYRSMTGILSPKLKPFHQKSISDLTPAICQSILDELKKERSWSNTTYNNVKDFGRIMFGHLIQQKIAQTNPFAGLKNLKEVKTQNQPFDDQTFERIKSEAEPDLLKFLLFLYHTGTRPNEARQLKHEHILRDRKILFIPGALSKSKVDGYVPLSDQFLELFPKGQGHIFGKSRNHYTNRFTELKKKLKLPQFYTLYSIKHTRAVHLAEAGASPYSIMQLFRHSSLEVTMDYLRGLGINLGREAAEKGLRM